MIVVGADLSTFAIDLVRLDYDTDRAEWRRIDLGGPKTPKLDRIRRVRQVMPRGTWWDDVGLVGIEQPAGHHGVADIAAIYGSVLQCIPSHLAVFNLRPAEWRKACGLPGNSPKAEVNRWAHNKRAAPEPVVVRNGQGVHLNFTEMTQSLIWPQDACDAYCIAYAARAINQTQEAA